MRLPLNALRTFAAVASRLSFSRGAEALNVTPAAVSAQVRALEDRLGQPLFHRTGRTVTLTAAGQALLPGVQRGLTEISQAVRSLEEYNAQGVLNVSMVPAFLQKWLMPRLGSFYQIHRTIDLRINADTALVSFTETDFHAAIRFGSGQWPELKAKKLLDDWKLPVCSPQFLQQIGPIKAPEQLLEHHLLNGEDEVWPLLFKGPEEAPRRRHGPILDDSVSIIAAAEQGQGIGMVRWSLVAAELESGRLVRPVPVTIKSRFAYYFVAPHYYFDMPKVAEFRSWLEECCRAFKTPEAVDSER